MRNFTGVQNVPSHSQNHEAWNTIWTFTQERNLIVVYCVLNPSHVQGTSAGIRGFTLVRNPTGVRNVPSHSQNHEAWNTIWTFTRERRLIVVHCVLNLSHVHWASAGIWWCTQERNHTDVQNAPHRSNNHITWKGIWKFTLDRVYGIFLTLVLSFVVLSQRFCESLCHYIFIEIFSSQSLKFEAKMGHPRIGRGTQGRVQDSFYFTYDSYWGGWGRAGLLSLVAVAS